MKSATTQLSSVLLAVFVLLAISAYKPVASKTTADDSYNGYWIAKSGEDFIVMNEARLPESALEKNAKGEISNVDKATLRSSLRFSNERQVNGKEIENHFFVVTKESVERSVKSVSPVSKKGLSFALTMNDIKAAYQYCTTGFAQGWGGQNVCSGGNSVCMAWKWATGESVYVMCNTN